MTNYQFLQTYIQLQKDIMFDELLDLGFATICYNKQDNSSFWNNALVNEVLDTDQIMQIAEKLHSLNRNSAFYFENRPDLSLFAKSLLDLGYSQLAEDSLMFHDGQNIDQSHFSQIRKVETEQDLELYLSTFNGCYQKDDPDNPYGELGNYILVTKEVWKKHHVSSRLEYFIAYKNDEPVAVSTLTNFKQVGYISNVCSLRSVRGQGYGKLATMYCVYESKKQGNRLHCLATEEGTHPNLFYKKIGFHTKFTALLLAKSPDQIDKV